MKVIREFAQPACMKMDAYRYTRLYKSMRMLVLLCIKVLIQSDQLQSF